MAYSAWRIARGANPFGLLLNIAEAVAEHQYEQSLQRDYVAGQNSASWSFPNHIVTMDCGPGDLVSFGNGFPQCGVFIFGSNSFVTQTTTNGQGNPIYTWQYDHASTLPYPSTSAWYKSGKRYEYNWAKYPALGIAVRTPGGPKVRPVPISVPLVIPHWALPYRKPHDGPLAGYDFDNGPGKPRPPDFHKYRRPRRDEKERKWEAGAAVRAALFTAFAATEAVDAIDILFDALPQDIQNATPRTGRTRRGARIGEGRSYLTTMDRARAIYANYGRLDWGRAATGLLINGFTDAQIGRMFGSVDNFRRMVGGSGWGASGFF